MGRGQRIGTTDLTAIRADGRAVGVISSPGLTGTAEAAIIGDEVHIIMRWTVFFVHGRIHARAPLEQMTRRPIRLEGLWEGDEFEGLTRDFQTTKLSP